METSIWGSIIIRIIGSRLTSKQAIQKNTKHIYIGSPKYINHV